jgi:hypothetical protein
MPIPLPRPSRAVVSAASDLGILPGVKSAAPDHVDITLLRWTSKVGIVLATLLMLAFGALAFYGIASGQTHGAGETVIAALIGAMFGGFGVAVKINYPAVMSRHVLHVDHTGVRYDVGRGGVKPFTVRWDELSAAAVSTAEHQSRTNGTTVVRLDLTPADPAGFPARHPEMDGIRHGTGYRLPLGPNRYLIRPVSEALRTFAGDRDRGVVDEGRAGPLTVI